MIGQIISHYRLVKLLGEGSFGQVYLGDDLKLPRQVAIKISKAKTDDSDSWMRFKREAAILASLKHQNIATIIEYDETEDGKQYIVMEFIEGHTLQDVLRHGALPSLRRCLDVVTEIAEALKAAHGKRVIHRDLKPGNVMLTFGPGIKVLDFGLAKRIKLEVPLDADTLEEALDASLTKAGMFMGTVQYTSPEQAKGERADERSDLFSLGAILYECLTGVPAFSGSSRREVLQQVIYIHPLPPSKINPQLPAELDRITIKALAKSLAERYQSAEELLKDLNQVSQTPVESAGYRTEVIPLQQPKTPSTLPSATTEKIEHSTREKVNPSFHKRWPRVLLLATFLFIPLILWGYWNWVWWPSHNLTRPKSLKAGEWYKQGLDSLQKGFYYQAKQSFENTINEEKDFVPAYALLAEALNELNFTDEAIEKIGVANHDLPRHFLFHSLDELYVDAIYQTVYRRYGEAIKAYQVIAERTTGSERWVVDNDLGRAFEKGDGKGKRVTEAISHYQEVVKLRDNPRALIRLAVLYGRKLESEAAKEYFKRAENTCNSLRVDECLPEVFYQFGAMLNRTGAPKEAQTEFDKALDSIPKNGEVNQYQNIKIRLQICSIKSQINPVAAKAIASEVIPLAKELGFRNLTIQGLLELGNAHLNSDELDDAAKKFNEALEQAGGKDLPEGKKLPSLAARAHLSLASLYVYRKDRDSEKVMPHIQEARKFFESGSYLSEQSQIYHLIGWNNENKDEYTEAIKAYERQLDLGMQTSSDLPVAEANFGLGSVYRSLERWSEAEARLKQSQEKYTALKDDEHIIQSKIYHSDVLVRLGKFKEAEQLLNEISAQTENPKADFTTFAEDVAMVRLRLAFNRWKFDEVIKQEQKIRFISKTEPETLIEAQYVSGLAYILKGNKRVGLALCQEACQTAKEKKKSLQVKRQLALAEAMLENGRWREALDSAGEANQFFSSYKQQDSEWRANLLMARASQGVGDWKLAETQAARARTILSDLSGQWGSNFTDKPDVQYYQKKLDELSGINQTQSNRRR